MRRFVLIANRQQDIQFQYSDFEYNDNTAMLLFKYDKTRIRVLKALDILGLKNSKANYALFFRKVFNKTINNNLEYNKNDDYVFIIMARVYEKYGTSLIWHLRKYYPSCKLVIYIVDVLGNMCFQVDEAKKHFDVICSFDEKEAKENDMRFLLEPFSTRYLNKVNASHTPQYDVSFVGAAKGRYNKIMWLYKYLTSKGLKCDFYIVGVDKKKQIQSEGLHYEWLSFESVLDHAVNSKCIVEIMQEDGYSATTRFAEAVLLKRNLITDCPALKNLEEESIIWFEENSDISIDRICKESTTDPKKYVDLLSIDTFINTINNYVDNWESRCNCASKQFVE